MKSYFTENGFLREIEQILKSDDKQRFQTRTGPGGPTGLTANQTSLRPGLVVRQEKQLNWSEPA